MSRVLSGLVAVSILTFSPAAFAQHTMHGTAMTAPAEHAVTVGDLEINGPFTRATLPNAQVGGGYFSISNTGSTDDVLVSATSPMAGEVQLHEMSIVNDIMQMRQLSDGIAIPAGETVELAPGGLHLMMMGITEPFVEGTTVPVTLTFETAGSVEIALAVGVFGAAAMDDHADHAEQQ